MSVLWRNGYQKVTTFVADCRLPLPCRSLADRAHNRRPPGVIRRSIITQAAKDRRLHWVAEIVNISGRFGDDSERVDQELREQIRIDGVTALLDHLRLCGSIPENCGHDSSEEKLYSKYTDILLAAAYRHMGMLAVPFTERADAADVEAIGTNYTLVADAKAFRLSRTAKNQKDFKVQAMDGWRGNKDYAVVVCPIYQLPNRTSQIYQQAIARNVLIFSYSHFALLLRYVDARDAAAAQVLLGTILQSTAPLNATKDAYSYWMTVNRAMLDFDPDIRLLWEEERIASLEEIQFAKAEALRHLARERERIMRMTKEEAILSLIRSHNIDNRERVIRAVADNGLLLIS
jgi:type II restriction enzyme